MARMSLEEAVKVGRVDLAKVNAATEEDIARFNAADGFDPKDTLRGLRPVALPAEIRAKAGLTQADMAVRLTVPLKTWRNWEQGRVTLEPTVQAFLTLVADDIDRAFRLLSGAPRPSTMSSTVATYQRYDERLSGRPARPFRHVPPQSLRRTQRSDQRNKSRDFVEA